MIKFKQKNGITLIALIITIIILLILAAVVINFAFGKSGIINKSKTTVAKYENAQKEEEIEIVKLNNKIEQYELKNYRDSSILENSEMSLLITASESSKNIATYTIDGFTRTNTENSEEFLVYNNTKKCYEVKKSGWYIIQLFNQMAQNNNYCSSILNLLLNNQVIAECPTCGRTNSYDYNSESITLYLTKGNEISCVKKIEYFNNDNWNSVNMKIWVLR